MNIKFARNATIPVLLSALAPVFAQQPLEPPLKNWTAPLYWAPRAAEAELQRGAQHGVSAQAQTLSIFTLPGPMTFIAMTPCRVMDTRQGQGFTGAFGPPTLAASTARQVPMSTSACNIPATAGAYSLNITALPVTTLSYFSIWPAGQTFPGVSTLNAPAGGIVANAAIVPAGTDGAVQMVAGNPTDVIIDINGYYAVPSDPSGNTAMGTGALASTGTGSPDVSDIANTAIGYQSLQRNTAFMNTGLGYQSLTNNSTGTDNTASGAEALSDNTTGSDNTAIGFSAMNNSVTLSGNTAIGSGASEFNTAGTRVVAVGFQALQNSNGGDNTAVGYQALAHNTSGIRNTALGEGTLAANLSGASNTATGEQALVSATSGNFNTALGAFTLGEVTTGSNNIAIGFFAGDETGPGSSNNIYLGNEGVAGDGTAANSGVIRIGASGTQTSFFAAGIRGVQTGAGNAVQVIIDSNGQLGTINSSRRFKEDIRDMGDASDRLLQLRPVTYRYQQPYADGTKPIDYGLIAEEVAEVYPDLVAYSPDGQVETVQYQKVNAMLLNEVQKQYREMSELKARLAEMEKRLDTMGTLPGRER